MLFERTNGYHCFDFWFLIAEHIGMFFVNKNFWQELGLVFTVISHENVASSRAL